jgi:acetate kinase
MTATAVDVTLAINAGSSSVKCAVFTWEAAPRVVAREVVEGTPSSGVTKLFEWVDAHVAGFTVAAIGHRIVHGGPSHREPQLITTAVLGDLGRLVPFAPNHLPEEIALIEAFQARTPAIPQIACFDTAFHHTLPDVARRLPIPQRYDAQGIRRYGFHGLSYAYVIEELGRLAGEDAAASRVILAHLGNGSSLAALCGGRSIDTTMAFTPIGGVVMSTRSGDLDPGVVTFLGRSAGLSADELEDLLSRRSGLLGVSGGESDMRTLLAREGSDAACRLAVDMYVYSVRKAIGAFAAALGGLDVLVFSGGIGEHAPAVRARICDRLGFLGVELDRDRNDANRPIISSAAAAVAVRVIPTDEELMIARAVHRLLASS